MSWRHAVLRLEGATWLLEDVGSTNGTFLGAQRVQRVEITQDCVLRLGHPEDGQRLWCSPAAPAPAGHGHRVALGGPGRPYRGGRAPRSRPRRPPRPGPPRRPRRGQASRSPRRPAAPSPPASPRPAGRPHGAKRARPRRRPTGMRQPGDARPEPAARHVEPAPAVPAGHGARRARRRPLTRSRPRIVGVEHRPPAQRDHAAAHPGAADRARYRQRGRRLRPERLPLPRRAAPVEPRRVRDRRPGQPQRHVRQRPAGDLRPGDRGRHHRHRAGHVPSRRRRNCRSSSTPATSR